MDDVPLYNSRILNTYLEFIRKDHPETNIEYVLNYAGITLYEVEDEGHWFNQKQVDRFYEVAQQNNRAGKTWPGKPAGLSRSRRHTP